MDREAEGGEGGLTFQALSKLLATGPGAIYWHVADKSDLVTAACDEIIARTMEAKPAGASPQETIRALALDLFDAIDAHPWVGAALMSAPGQLPMVRIFERLGQQVRTLGVSAEHEWSAVSALLNHILGVAGQNAANAKLAARSVWNLGGVYMSGSWGSKEPPGLIALALENCRGIGTGGRAMIRRVRPPVPRRYGGGR